MGNNKDINNYVCRECFNKLNDCKCKEYPLFLIHMDKEIQEHIKILNKKNYRTRFCCASHNKSLYIHIVFAFDYFKDYTEEQLPQDFKYNKNKHTLYCNINCRKMSLEEINKQRTLALNNLFDFCKNLKKLNDYRL